MSSSTTPQGAQELFQQGIETFEAAVKASIAVQEEWGRRITDMMRHLGTPVEWQQRTQSVFSEAISLTQRNIDESVRVMSQNARTAMNLMQRAFEVAPGQNGSQAANDQMWESILGAMRRSTQAVLQANARVIESWTELARELNGRYQQAQSA